MANRWTHASVVDLDRSSRAVTLRALGQSVLGLDLEEDSDAVGPALKTALKWAADRGSRPVNPPQWVPTPGQLRARRANNGLRRLARRILASCRNDPDREAPLVRAPMAATDPDTGRALDDEVICNELVLFVLAGHDTTATTLCFALWQLGRDPVIQIGWPARFWRWVTDR